MIMPITLEDVYMSKKDYKRYYVDNIFINTDREVVIIMQEYGYDGRSNGMRICTTEMIDNDYELV